LKPLSIVLLTDGVPDLGGNTRDEKFRNLNLKPLEGLSRNITVRVLYTDAVTAKNWRDEVPRKRVKVWTQDAVVMKEWDDPRTMVPGKSFAEQEQFFSWLKDNVDFSPRLKRWSERVQAHASRSAGRQVPRAPRRGADKPFLLAKGISASVRPVPGPRTPGRSRSLRFRAAHRDAAFEHALGHDRSRAGKHATHTVRKRAARRAGSNAAISRSSLRTLAS
jgi:hypothetical protein